MKQILLPTDLSVASLWPVHDIVKDACGKKVRIHLVHMLQTPTSIGDLLTLKITKPYAQVPAAFTEAYQLLCNRYEGQLDCLRFKFIYGNTLRYLNNFIDGAGIDEVYLLTHYHYETPLPQSIEMTGLIKRCKAQLRTVPLHTRAAAEYGILSALLRPQTEDAAAGNSSHAMVSFT